jgi:AAA15 family ATPase/GTPase
MIQAIKIKNFKALEETDWIPLQGNVVFVGPNNSGKTTALQAFALWNYGIQKWIEKRQNSKAVIRTGAVMNRKDLFAIPVSNSKFIWTNLFPLTSERDESGKIKGTKNINIEIIVKGINDGKEWICGLEFRFDNEEAIYVKPLHGLENNLANDDISFLKNINVAFLPPMSGLKLEEEKLLFSTVEYRMGEGRTAEVLGNLCYQVINPENEILAKDRTPSEDWKLMTQKLKKLFLVDLIKPELDNKGLIKLKYTDAKGNELEMSSSGRGMQQIILLLAYILIKPKCIILLDEPDAHLEILKQEQVYELLSDIAQTKGSQLLIASHSEVVLRKAIATKDNVISFYPHSKPKYYDNPLEILKALKTIGFEEYYLAQQNGWILYLEGGTDLPMLKRFAEKLQHPVLSYLENCFYKTINTDDPAQARNHFTGLKAAKPNLIGIAVYDNIQFPIGGLTGLSEIKWVKNEIENYFFSQEVMIKWAQGKISQDLFGPSEAQQREIAMKKALDDVLPGAARRDDNDNYWSEIKASTEIEKILRAFYKYMEHPGDSSKGKYVNLIDYLPVDKIHDEVKEKLDFILQNIPKPAVI